MKMLVNNIQYTTSHESCMPLKTKTSEQLLTEIAFLRQIPQNAASQKQFAALKKQLVLKNIPLVRSISKKYQQLSYLEEDLLQEGIIGLLEAISRFDHTRGYKFSTVATIWIKNSINKYIESKVHAIRMPKDLYHLAQKTVQLQEKQPELSVEDIAARFNVKVTHITTALEYFSRGHTLSLYFTDNEGREQERSDKIATTPVEEEYLEQSMIDTIKEALTFLPPKDAEYMRKSYGIDHEKVPPVALTNIFEKSPIEISQYRKTIRKRLKRILERSFSITSAQDLCSY